MAAVGAAVGGPALVKVVSRKAETHATLDFPFCGLERKNGRGPFGRRPWRARGLVGGATQTDSLLEP